MVEAGRSDFHVGGNGPGVRAGRPADETDVGPWDGGVQMHVQEGDVRHLQPDLLTEFPHQGLGRLFPAAEPAARQGPRAFVAVGVVEQEDAAPVVDDYADDAEKKLWVYQPEKGELQAGRKG